MRLLATKLDTSYESIERQIEKSQVVHIAEKITQTVLEKKPRDEMLEEYLLSLLLQSSTPKKAADSIYSMLGGMMPHDRAYQKILSLLLTHFAKQDGFDAKRFGNTLPSELLKTYDTCFLYPLPKFTDEVVYLKEVEKIATELKLQYIRSKMKLVAAQIKEKEAAGEATDVLHAEFSHLSEALQSREQSS
jgi:hypothetical protein